MGEGVHNRGSVTAVLQAMIKTIYRCIKISDEIDIQNVIREALCQLSGEPDESIVSLNVVRGIGESFISKMSAQRFMSRRVVS